MDISTATDSWHTGGLGAFSTSVSSNTEASRRLKTEMGSEKIIEQTDFDASKAWTGKESKEYLFFLLFVIIK